MVDRFGLGDIDMDKIKYQSVTKNFHAIKSDQLMNYSD